MCGKIYPLKTNFYRDKYSKNGWGIRCKTCGKAYREKNKDRIKTRKRVYYKKNRDEINNKQKAYAKENRDKYAANSAKRRASKQKQTTKLTDTQKELIKLYYKVACWLGEHFHVDHTIPITKGGTHHPNNLQIIPAYINLRKHNDENYTIPKNQIIKLQIKNKTVIRERLKSLGIMIRQKKTQYL